MRLIFAFILVFLSGCSLFPKHSPELTLPSFSLQIDDVEPAVAQCLDALYLIEMWSILHGDFFDHTTQTQLEEISGHHSGTGFMIDGEGRIITNAHVLDPEYHLEEFFRYAVPVVAGGIKTGYDINRIDSIDVIYFISDLSGNTYEMYYELDFDIRYIDGTDVPIGIDLHSIDHYNKKVATADILKIDDVVDVALLQVEDSGLPYIPFGDFESLEEHDDVFGFSIQDIKRGEDWDDIEAFSLEIKHGSLLERRVVSNLRGYHVAKFSMIIKPGFSGGPVVIPAGKFVGIIHAMERPPSGTTSARAHVIPESSIRDFYNHVVYGAPKPMPF